MQRIESLDICARCGGLCCLNAPGGFSPNDLARSGNLSTSDVNDALNAGTAIMSTAFVNIENQRAAPLLKLNARGIDREPLSLCHMPTQCAHLQGKQCGFSLDERPFECAVMVPNRDITQCGMPDGMPAELLWVGHQGILRQVVSSRTGLPWAEEILTQMHARLQIDEYAYGAWQLVEAIGFASDDSEVDMIIAAWKDTCTSR